MKEINYDDLIDIDFSSKMHKKRSNGFYLSDEQVNVLEKYNIDYLKYNNIKSLLFDIEEILNEETDLDDLDNISRELAEYNYYNNTNK